MPPSESASHLELKRLALIWAQANHYSVAACEVSLPNLRFRVDVGAYRPGSRRELREDSRWKIKRLTKVSALGAAAVFEAKCGRADFLRDSRRTDRVTERLKVLGEKKSQIESVLKLNYPSLRKGDELWPEYESYAFEQVEDAAYWKVLKELKMLSGQLHSQTKLDNLLKWKAANLHYRVVEPSVLNEHELPLGWGLLVRSGDRLTLQVRPEWHEIDEQTRLTFLHRVAIAGTKATNREQLITYPLIDAERRGI
ncbi:MAG: hypothetical protein JWL90_3464 [Chthoniobacteraceae bacterium]|nr:hypothetical protein [Chthoniobacteraceae bacterium]